MVSKTPSLALGHDSVEGLQPSATPLNAAGAQTAQTPICRVAENVFSKDLKPSVGFLPRESGEPSLSDRHAEIFEESTRDLRESALLVDEVEKKRISGPPSLHNCKHAMCEFFPSLRTKMPSPEKLTHRVNIRH
jgi:hypothetical protein